LENPNGNYVTFGIVLNYIMNFKESREVAG